MARPAKLTPELTQEITTHIRDGNSPTISATLVGISSSTYFNWMSKGSNQEPKFMEFLESIERAKAQSIVNRVAYIARAADGGNWRAAAWLLERIAPESFGKHSHGCMEQASFRQEEVNDKSEASFEELEEKVRKIKLIRGELS
jgi:hypothetical protein